jgi:(3,5-dihydroxyphenyl)acetyl-CoA 1,2-dioxygenase
VVASITAVEAVLQAQKAEEQHADEAALKSRARAVKDQFFRRHAAAIYDEVTDDGARFLRVSEVVAAASNRYPALLPPAPASPLGCLRGSGRGEGSSSGWR